MSRFLVQSLMMAFGLGAAGFAAPAYAWTDHRESLGSGTDNPDLYAPYPAADIASGPLREAYTPFFDLDWSVNASGTVQQDSTGQHFETDITPSMTLTHQGSRDNLSFSADADISRVDDTEAQLNALRLAFAADYLLDTVTKMSATGSLDVNQLTSIDPTLSTSLSAAPQIITGALAGEVTRQFGKLAVNLRGSIGRSVYGDSLSDTGEVVTNGNQNVTTYGTGLRLSYALSPILSGFVDGSADKGVYDMASLKLDGTTYALRAGLSANWQNIWTMEGSVGVGLLDYDDDGTDDVNSTLYDASLSFSPDETMKFTAGFFTTIAPPSAATGEGTRVDYEATADVAYTVNSWLALRANAVWDQTSLANSATPGDSGYGFGLGADYLFNSHATLSADYGFSHTEQPPDADEDVHRVTLGVTISK